MKAYFSARPRLDDHLEEAFRLYLLSSSPLCWNYQFRSVGIDAIARYHLGSWQAMAMEVDVRPGPWEYVKEQTVFLARGIPCRKSSSPKHGILCPMLLSASGIAWPALSEDCTDSSFAIISLISRGIDRRALGSSFPRLPGSLAYLEYQNVNFAFNQRVIW